MNVPEGLRDALDVTLLHALLGRRARRFFLGAEIPDGPLAFRSRHAPVPLDELETLVLLAALSGNTGWHYGITRHARYAPHLSNYSGSASGRTFPSAAGVHTSELFFTNDEGTFFYTSRDVPPPLPGAADPEEHLEELVRHARSCIRPVRTSRMHVPAREPYMEGHNTWVANRPGTTLFMPVGDLAQHMLFILCFLVQNGFCITDDLNGRRIPGLEKFKRLVDTDNPFPLTYMEQYALTELTAELSTSCYAGTLMLQAMGLGGWMFDGIDRHSILGGSGDDSVGLGFRYDTDPRWAMPNPTGLPGVFEAFCPPHYRDMRAATEAVVRRKFGPGGPFHPDTPGAWRETRRVRSSAQVHDEEFIDCVTTMAQYVFDTFGKFPGTVPSTFCLTYLQAHHLDLEFYDHHFLPGAYLDTHARHMERWHGTPLVPRREPPAEQPDAGVHGA